MPTLASTWARCSGSSGSPRRRRPRGARRPSVAPKHLASWLAYTEACLATGDAVAASAAIDAALALEPGNPPARTLPLLTSAALGDPNADWPAFAEAVRADPGLVAAPARAQLIATAVDRTRGPAGAAGILRGTRVDAGQRAARAARESGRARRRAVGDARRRRVARRARSTRRGGATRCPARTTHSGGSRAPRSSLGRGEAARHLAAAYARACATRFAPRCRSCGPAGRRARRCASRCSHRPMRRPRRSPHSRALSGAGCDITLVALASTDEAKPFAASLPFVAQVVIAAGACPIPSGGAPARLARSGRRRRRRRSGRCVRPMARAATRSCDLDARRSRTAARGPPRRGVGIGALRRAGRTAAPGAGHADEGGAARAMGSRSAGAPGRRCRHGTCGLLGVDRRPARLCPCPAFPRAARMGCGRSGSRRARPRVGARRCARIRRSAG